MDFYNHEIILLLCGAWNFPSLFTTASHSKITLSYRIRNDCSERLNDLLEATQL